MFASVANNFMPLDKTKVIFGGGDLNCRIGNLMNEKRLPQGKYRCNPDPDINSNGKSLVDICKSFHCYPLNNLTYKDKNFDGKFTFYGGNGKSQNDIVVGNRYSLDRIQTFTVHEIAFNPSDHFPVVVTCNAPLYEDDIKGKAAADLLTEPGEPKMRKPTKIVPTKVDWNAYKMIVETECVLLKEQTEELIVQPNENQVNKIINNVSRKLYSVAKTCSNNFMNNPITPNEDPSAPLTHLIEESEKSFKKYISGDTSMNEWLSAKAVVVEENKRSHFSKISQKWCDLIKENDAKKIWNAINWKGAIGSDDFLQQQPTSKELSAHFLTKSDAHEQIDTSTVPANNYVHDLDKPISIQEVTKSASLLKDGKSTCDGWCPKMVRCINDSFYPIVTLLFSTIFCFALFPIKWCTTLVAAIFKRKGSSDNAKNYRPVALVYLLYKWFDFILLSRFKSWFSPADEQTAYQGGRSCADHIFLLKCLIYFAKSKRAKFFLCTIDFDGAFDRISRNILIKKLALFGAGSTFIYCIAAMYSQTDSIIIQADNYSSYTVMSGIKQGLPLSPFLFLFYVNDIFDFFYGIYGYRGTSLLNKLHLLVHADDANILSSTREMMTAKIRSMVKYCINNKIVLQLSKCKFIVINGSPEDKEIVMLDVGPLKCVNEVMILGSPLTDSGIIQKDLDLHLKERYTNVIKFFNFIRSNRCAPISIKLKVLSSCVLSTLLYNCETFGNKLPKGIEKLYFKLLKCALNVRENTPNEIVLIEAGFLPIQALVKKRQLKFFRRFKESFKNHSLRQSVLNELLQDQNATPFIKHYSALDEQYNDPNEIYVEAFGNLKTSIRSKASTDQNYRFFIYCKVNPDLLPSPFLSCNINADLITRFRLGSHKLPIETGRWTRTPRAERLCPKCNVLGDEYHVLFHCSEILKNPDHNFTGSLHEIWSNENVFNLFKELQKSEFV